MTLRRAGPDDAATLVRLNAHVQDWHAARYPDVFFATPDRVGLTIWFSARLADPACTVFLVGDPAVGYALCTLQTREASVFSPAIRRLLIDHIAVDPVARRQGYGRALLDAARQLARDERVDEILLDTWEANHDAQDFFRASGFEPRRRLFRATP